MLKKFFKYICLMLFIINCRSIGKIGYIEPYPDDSIGYKAKSVVENCDVDLMDGLIKTTNDKLSIQNQRDVRNFHLSWRVTKQCLTFYELERQ